MRVIAAPLRLSILIVISLVVLLAGSTPKYIRQYSKSHCPIMFVHDMSPVAAKAQNGSTKTWYAL